MKSHALLKVVAKSVVAASLVATPVFVSTLCGRAVAAPATVPPEGMVYVPAGEFIMGTNESDRSGENVPLANNDARPQHAATTKAFYLDKLEVTNQQYKTYCDATHYPVPPYWKNGTFLEGQANVPVRWVSWYEAQAFANWVGKRLPTETEWEKAARGTDGRRFPWGNSWNGNNAVFGTDGPEDAGSHPDGASPYGALDMAGNVYEWTGSWFEAYPNNPATVKTFGKIYRVVRGGGYSGYEMICQTSYRSVCRPQSRTEWIGFRCARDAP